MEPDYRLLARPDLGPTVAPFILGGCILVTIAAVILARSESPDTPGRLLPERSLAEIHGRPVLAWTASRLRQAATLDRIMVAVGDRDQDRAIIELAERLGLDWVAGHPDNILARLLLAAGQAGADHAVRVNGNFPLVDPTALDRLTQAHLEQEADFSLNSHYHGLVYGLGVEVFSVSALKRALTQGLDGGQSALGSLLLHQHPERYKTFLLPARSTAPHLRVSIDFARDLQVVSEILARVPEPDNDRIIEFLEQRPDLTAWGTVSPPAEVSLEKVLLFPEKLSAVRRNNCVTFDATYPISVELSLTNRCNHRCVWCSDADLRQRLGGEMGPEILFPLFEDLKAGGTRGVVIEGGGEPTLHSDFEETVRQAESQGLALGLITNGFLLPWLDLADRFEWVTGQPGRGRP